MRALKEDPPSCLNNEFGISLARDCPPVKKIEKAMTAILGNGASIIMSEFHRQIEQLNSKPPVMLQ